MSFVKNLNTPNKLTILRILLVPVFIVFLFLGQNNILFKYLALFVFCAASVTDALDGYIARSRNLVTNFGKFILRKPSFNQNFHFSPNQTFQIRS